MWTAWWEEVHKEFSKTHESPTFRWDVGVIQVGGVLLPQAGSATGLDHTALAHLVLKSSKTGDSASSTHFLHTGCVCGPRATSGHHHPTSTRSLGARPTRSFLPITAAFPPMCHQLSPNCQAAQTMVIRKGIKSKAHSLSHQGWPRHRTLQHQYGVMGDLQR